MTRNVRKIRVTSPRLPARVATPLIEKPFPGAPRRSATAALVFHALALWALASISMPVPPAPPPRETFAVTLLESPPPPPEPAPSATPPPPESVAVKVEQREPDRPPTQETVKVLPSESPLVLIAPVIAADAKPEPARAVPIAAVVQHAGPAPLSAYWLSVRAAVAQTVRYPSAEAIDTNILVRVERTVTGFIVAEPAAGGGDAFARSVCEAAERVALRFPPPPVDDPAGAEWIVRFVK